MICHWGRQRESRERGKRGWEGGGAAPIFLYSDRPGSGYGLTMFCRFLACPYRIEISAGSNSSETRRSLSCIIHQLICQATPEPCYPPWACMCLTLRGCRVQTVPSIRSIEWLFALACSVRDPSQVRSTLLAQCYRRRALLSLPPGVVLSVWRTWHGVKMT